MIASESSLELELELKHRGTGGFAEGDCSFTYGPDMSSGLENWPLPLCATIELSSSLHVLFDLNSVVRTGPFCSVLCACLNWMCDLSCGYEKSQSESLDESESELNVLGTTFFSAGRRNGSPASTGFGGGGFSTGSGARPAEVKARTIERHIC